MTDIPHLETMADLEVEQWAGMTSYVQQAALSDAVDRLISIREIVERVDRRCMAVDGPVTPTLDEMTQAEISEIYHLSGGG